MWYTFTINSLLFLLFPIISVTVRAEDHTVPDGVKNTKDVMDEEYEDILEDTYTFVALIDVVFTNGLKKTCTGTIIHENVVLTAANCFIYVFDENIQPELTTSFVVIGSKKMFESGYEQYLPIERIITHPKFDGWRAALSLVFTFAGMTSDKPGKILKLAGDKTSNPVDANVTVYSWGKVKDGEVLNNKQNDRLEQYDKHTHCPESSSSEHFRLRADTTKQDRAHKLNTDRPDVYVNGNRIKLPRNVDYQLHKVNMFKNAMDQKNIERVRAYKSFPSNSRHVTVDQNKHGRNIDWDENSELEGGDIRANNNMSMNRNQLQRRQNKIRISANSLRPTLKRSRQMNTQAKPLERNWRRAMGSQQNRLVVKVFGFVNIGNCKKIIEGSAAPQYGFKHGEVACYASEERHITDEDIGAPAVRHGRLVAVTVGGAECDGDHVGVGLKMSCYCSWIADNLPKDANLVCCKNCCEVKHTEESARPTFRQRRMKYDSE